MRRCPSLNIQPGALIVLALMVLLVEFRWVGAFLFSTAIHELCHILALFLLGCPIHQITVGMAGAKIHTDGLSRKQELIASLAGPLGASLLVLTVKWFPRLALCAFFHTTVNLIPVFPLDGGRALRSLISEKYYRITEPIVFASLLVIGYTVLGKVGALLAIFLITRPVFEKLLAKNRLNGYNRPTIK